MIEGAPKGKYGYFDSCLRDALEAAFNAGLVQGRNANPSDKANT